MRLKNVLQSIQKYRAKNFTHSIARYRMERKQNKAFISNISILKIVGIVKCTKKKSIGMVRILSTR